MAFTVYNSDGTTREVTREQFIHDLNAAQAKARAQAAEAEHVRVLREEAAAESARCNRRAKVDVSDPRTAWMNGVKQLFNEAGLTYVQEGSYGIKILTAAGDYTLKISKNRK